MTKALYLGVSLLVLPLVVAFTYEAALFVASAFSWGVFAWLLAGMGLFLLVYILFLAGRIDFLEHLIHEFEHAMIPFFLTGNLPIKMEIDPSKKSQVQVVGVGGCATTLAPYFFPLLAVPLLLLKALTALVLSLLETPFPSFLAGAFDVLIGATLMLHFIGLFKEFRLRQTDIRKTGILCSVVTVFFLNVLLVVVTAAVVASDYAGLLDYVRVGATRSLENYQVVLEFGQSRVLPAIGNVVERFRGGACPDCTPTPIGPG